ncbi:hypothetical protein JYT57_00450 [Nitrosarchaeum koreense]|nr:hypothetical protein [Nitrosarchaeum koreense]
MGKVKKVGIGFGVIIGLFFALIIAVGISIEIEKANMTPEELQQYEEDREQERLLKEQKAEKERLEKEANLEKMRLERKLQEESKKEKEVQELIKQKEIESQDGKLNSDELQTLIAGFESYNKSVKILLDMCVNVESEMDLQVLGLLISGSGSDFIVNTANYGAVREKLIDEGYRDHSELGPLMNQSVILVDQMTTCMDLLAWEFGG